MSTRFQILDVAVDELDEDGLDQAADRAVEAGEGSVVVLTLRRLMRARRDWRYGQHVGHATLIANKSPVIEWAARLRGRQATRFTIFAVAVRLLSAVERAGQTAYLLGATHPVLRRAERNLTGSFPRLRIVGRYEGRYPIDREADILTAIRKAAPHLLMVGAGARNREGWLADPSHQIEGCLTVYVEDCLHIFAGMRSRAKTKAGRALRVVGTVFVRPWRLFEGLRLLSFLSLLALERLRGS